MNGLWRRSATPKKLIHPTFNCKLNLVYYRLLHVVLWWWWCCDTTIHVTFFQHWFFLSGAEYFCPLTLSLPLTKLSFTLLLLLSFAFSSPEPSLLHRSCTVLQLTSHSSILKLQCYNTQHRLYCTTTTQKTTQASLCTGSRFIWWQKACYEQDVKRWKSQSYKISCVPFIEILSLWHFMAFVTFSNF